MLTLITVIEFDVPFDCWDAIQTTVSVLRQYEERHI
jgi:hypothetical protein